MEKAFEARRRPLCAVRSAETGESAKAANVGKFETIMLCCASEEDHAATISEEQSVQLDQLARRPMMEQPIDPSSQLGAGMCVFETTESDDVGRNPESRGDKADKPETRRGGRMERRSEREVCADDGVSAVVARRVTRNCEKQRPLDSKATSNWSLTLLTVAYWGYPILICHCYTSTQARRSSVRHAGL